MRTTTKDTKDTKVEFVRLSNRVVGCAHEVDRRFGQIASISSFSGSFVLFVSFVVK